MSVARHMRPLLTGLPGFITRRIGASLLLALGISLALFVLTHLVPADPVTAFLGQGARNDPNAVATFRHNYGLDRPLPMQYLIYLGNMMQGDLGTSIVSHRPVVEDLRLAFPATIELALVAFFIAVVIGLGLGMYAALRKDRWQDQLIRVVSLAGVSAPVFWVALVTYYIFFFRLKLLPGGGRLDPGVDPPANITGMFTLDSALTGRWELMWSAFLHLLMPACVLAVATLSVLVRFTRAAVLEVLQTDYVRAGRAQGLPNKVLLVHYILRPALVSIITVAGIAFGVLMVGAVLVEAIFAWPGIGQYAYKATVSLDIPAIMGVSLLVGLVFISINLVVDIMYGIIDPRIRMK